MKKRCEALFLIKLSVFLIFSIFFITAAEAQVCCEQTKNGDNCVFTSSSNCDTSLRLNNLLVSCEQTDYCKVGCCISDIGQCFKNTGRADCEASGGTFSEDATCSTLSQCNTGCCVVGNQCSLGTETQCEIQTQKLIGAEKNFFSVSSEAECLNFCALQQEGCCVESSGCTAGSGSCSGKYEAGKFCSSIAECECTAKAKKGCFEDDVYWFDSCGNREEKAEDCSFEQGTICKNIEGDYKCGSLNCESTTDVITSHDSRLGGRRSNGESWCIYESPVGDFLDRPGSRHYRAVCFNGEEIIEPCRDFREEICLQADKNGVSSSNCIGNIIDVSEKFNARTNGSMPNVTLVPIGFKFWEDERSSLFSTTRTGGNAEAMCARGNTQCVVLFVKKNRFSSWKVEQGKECLEQKFIDNAATLCKAQGDCGADFNVVGVFSEDGFSNSADVSNNDDDIGHFINFPKKVSEAQKKEWNKFGVFGNIRDMSSLLGRALEEFDQEELGRETRRLTGDAILKVSFLGLAYTSSIKTLMASTAINKGASLFASGALTDSSSLASGASFGTGVSGVGTVASVQAAMNPSFIATDATFISEGALTFGEGGLGTSIAASGSQGMIAGCFAAPMCAVSVALMALNVIRMFVDFRVPILDDAMEFIGGLVMGKAKIKIVTVSTSCRPWIPPIENNCDECGVFTGADLGCTEYQCRSLGANCRFIPENEGTNRTACVEINVNDVASPRISPWEGALSAGFSLTDFGGGYKINEEAGAFEKISFGILTDESAQCRIDNQHKNDFDDMVRFFGDSSFSMEHKIEVSLPEGKEANLFVRCKDFSGNENVAEYVITIRTSKGPDFTPPIVNNFEVPPGSFLKSGQEMATIPIILNEPTECKWSLQDKDFDAMENEFQCDEATDDDFGNLQFRCLAGVNVTSGINQFFVRCRDSSGNKNQESILYTLTGSSTLTIEGTAPNGKVFTTNSPTLQVKTINGAQEGKSQCFFSEQDVSINLMTRFFETDSSLHQQQLQNLPKGDYNFFIRCKDIAGNEDSGKISFSIEADTSAPQILKVVKESSAIKVTFDEEVKCEYAKNTFTFGQGSKTETGKTIKLPLQQKLHVKCEDSFNNLLGEVIIYT